MFLSFTAALFAPSANAETGAECIERFEEMTALIELFSAVGAFLIAAAVVFIIIRENRKKRGHS